MFPYIFSVQHKGCGPKDLFDIIQAQGYLGIPVRFPTHSLLSASKAPGFFEQ